jgi:hypothetical protein
VTKAGEYVPPGTILITCRCCQLRQSVRERDGAEPTMCDECHQHQGQLPDKRLARAESHEAMLRERLIRCRASEAKAQRALETVDERVASALDSRGALADRIVSAARNTGTHSCDAVQIGRDPAVVEYARRYGERHGRTGR